MASPKGKRRGGYSPAKDINTAKAELAEGQKQYLDEGMGQGKGRHRKPGMATAVDHRQPHGWGNIPGDWAGSHGVAGLYYSRNEHFGMGRGD